MPALLQAVRARLRAALTLDDRECDIRPDGHPDPMAGQEFWAVHAGDVTPGPEDGDMCLDEMHEVRVTLTHRVAHIPDDRLGEQAIVKATTGLYARAKLAQVALHMNYTVLDLVGGAYTAAGTGWAGGQSYSLPLSVEGFIEPLKWKRTAPPTPCGPEWFSSEGEPGDADVGLSLEMVFADARRLQTLESMA